MSDVVDTADLNLKMNLVNDLRGYIRPQMKDQCPQLKWQMLANESTNQQISTDMQHFEQTFEAYIDSFSGATGAVVANLLFYPLENLRTRVQVLRSKRSKKNGDTNTAESEQIDSTANKDNSSKELDRSLGLIEILIRIIRKDGVLAMYTGLSAALVGTVVSYGIYFWWYRFLKNKFSLYTGRKSFTKGEVAVITAISGTLSSFLGNPIWMLNTRMINKKKEEEDAKITYFQMIKQIYKNEGLWAFYKGFIPNFILVLNPIINFVIYEGLRNVAVKKYKEEKLIPFWVTFIVSSIGKIAATIATFPILTIRVWAHTNKFAEMEGSSIVRKILKFIQINGIISGLYKGVEAKLLQTVLYNAFMMVVYEYLRQIVKRILFYTVYLKLKK